MIPTFIRAYEASAAVTPNRIVAYSDAAASRKVALAAAATAAIMGVSDRLGADLGGMCDVTRAGLSAVELGGTVAAGDPLTSDATGRAIKAVPASNTAMRIVGWADEPGVVGDIIDAWIDPGQFTNPA